MSGIMAIFFAGLVTNHYAIHNIPAAAANACGHFFDALAFLSESFVFACVPRAF